MTITSVRRGWLAVLLIMLLVASALPFISAASQSSGLVIRQTNQEYTLSASGLGTFHRTPHKIANARLIEAPESRTELAVWEEQRADGRTAYFYAISLDGQTVARVQETSYDILLRYSKFDPVRQRPAIPENLRAGAPASDTVYIVQFVTQPLEEFRKAIEARGGTVYNFLANHSYLVQMNARTRAEVESLSFVRWVGEYQPAYRLEEFLLERLNGDSSTLPEMSYNIMALERGARQQEAVAGRIRQMGGKVRETGTQGFILKAMLTAEQLLAVAKMNEVLFIDRTGGIGTDMDVVRNVSGANFIENTLGYTGQGVRAEIMDSGVLTTHQAFQARPLISHGSLPVDFHGTVTTGIAFGDGAASITGRGMLPGAQGIIAPMTTGEARYTHTAELLQPAYSAVFQSNSWGSDQNTVYSTISAQFDDLLFINDLAVLQSQSNLASNLSRPEAWAKNAISVGGVLHFNTPEMSDDCWKCNGFTVASSTGPAADGRVKPDLVHFFDRIYAPNSLSNISYGEFSGTSASTPIVAGHFGIFFQMWHNGIFGNPTGASVFASRPHMTTSKAMMINTATQWNPVGISSDLTRVRQGWGRPDLQTLYNLREKMFYVNETDLLTNLGSKSYTLIVPAGSTTPFKATLVYADPLGNPASTQHRINDLTLKVTSPSNVVYWGNVGLSGTGQWSTPGGEPNSIDTVENVYIQNPEAGAWTVQVIASEIVQDAHTETPATDADYALVVTGVNRSARKTPFDFDGDGRADVAVFRPGTGDWHILQSSNSSLRSQTWGLSTDHIAPADYDGDGKTDIAVFRAGAWYVSCSSDNSMQAQMWGASGDIPVAADYDGDAKADFAIFRTSDNSWYILQSSNNSMSSITFGASGDVPVAADYDGDGKADIAVYRPGSSVWYALRSTTGFLAQQFGTSGDVPVTADYDADGKSDLAVFRSSINTWFTSMNPSTNFGAVQWGAAGDVLAPADYDGDGRADVAVFRPTEGNWYILQSSDSAQRSQLWGAGGDVAVPSAYIR
jgi:hypothetical protein